MSSKPTEQYTYQTELLRKDILRSPVLYHGAFRNTDGSKNLPTRFGGIQLDSTPLIHVDCSPATARWDFHSCLMISWCFRLAQCRRRDEHSNDLNSTFWTKK